MKRKLRSFLAVFVVIMVVVSVFPPFVLAERDTQRDFNIFLDAGEITDEYRSKVTQMKVENWSDEYFSNITMPLGEDVMYVDGEQVELSFGASVNGENDLILPAKDLAEAAGIATVEQQIGDTIEQSQAEELFLVDICLHDNMVKINKPYQTKQIILYVRGGNALTNNYQAKDFATNHQGLYFLQYASEEQTKVAYEAFIADEEIEYVTLNSVVKATSLPSPSWGTNGNENSMGIQAEIMKNQLQDCQEEILVAVLDTGVDSEYLPGTANGREGHPHLEGRTTVATSQDDDTKGWNYINDNNNSYDTDGHGTHVAGTIVDCTPNNVKILPVKVLNDKGTGDEATISNAILYAAQQGAKVINMSLGGSCLGNCLLKQVIATINSWDQPPMIVAGAGNDGAQANDFCPARLSLSYDNVASVSAVNQNDVIASFSNYGSSVDVCAPGVNIYSSTPGGKYEENSGTSMATPHVSAAVAMLMLKYPNYTSAQIKSTLKSMTVDLGEPGWDAVYGSGRIDFRMLELSADSIPAQSFELNSFDGNLGTSPSITIKSVFGNEFVGATVMPKETTDKSVEFVSQDESIARYSNSRAVAKSYGTTTFVASKGDLLVKSVSIQVLDAWLYHASKDEFLGEGTENDPYLISTPEQLAKLSFDSRNDGNPMYANKYFKLTNNIDLGGKFWTPIGMFRGCFDGNGHVISNMVMEDAYEKAFFGVQLYHSGLFAEIDDSCIKNLGVVNANITVPARSLDNYGILCGAAYNSQISNCYTTGRIPNGAGLVGQLSGASVMRDCYTIVDEAKYGIVGSNSESYIYNCYSAGRAVGCTSGFLESQRTQNNNNSSVGVVNSFSITTIPSGNGFVKEKSDGVIQNCYYLNENTVGIELDSNSATTLLTAKPIDFFVNQDTYTNSEFWDSSSPWDFENVWAMDDNGLPYLKTFQRTLVNGITLENCDIGEGYSTLLSATVFPIDATNKAIKWVSANPSIASVNQQGMVTGNQIGITTITAVSLDGGAQIASCTVNVIQAVTGIIIFRTSTDPLLLGGWEFLSATAFPMDAYNTEVIWTSLNPDVVTVSSNGMVTAVGYGTAMVEARAADGQGAFACCSYTISDDYHNEIYKAKTVYENTAVQGTIGFENDEDCFQFTPSVSGTYFFSTSGFVDTNGVLYNSNEEQLAVNDSGENGNINFGIKYSLTAGETYYIKIGGNTVSLEEHYTFVVEYEDDYSDDILGATPIDLHSTTVGVINCGNDKDYFSFTPTASGSYLFYTTGSTDTKGTLYNSSGTQLKVNNNGSINGNNFAFAYTLTKDQTYYINVANNNSSTGAYTLIVSKSFYSASYTNTNADARKVLMSAEAASVLTNLTITINGTTYSLTKPTSGGLDKTVNGVRFKVTFTSKNSGLSTLWNITANMPATAIGSTTTTKFTFSKGIVTGISSSNLTGLVAYGSSYKTNLTPNTYLSTLLSSMATSGYTFTAYDWNDQQITATTTTKVATGQKILQKNSSGKIVHVYYLVLFGDVAGSGVVGDGLINATDSMKVLKEVEKTFLGAISKLAADADHNGSISQADAELILQHSVGKATINQNVAIPQAVDNSCYFQTPVAF